MSFLQAVTEGRCDVVDSMLANGYTPDPNIIDVPCKDGNLDMLLRLLSSGHKMNMRRGFVTAVKNNHSHLLYHLFINGANVNDEY